MKTFTITSEKLAKKIFSLKKQELEGLMTRDEFLRRLESYEMVFDSEFLAEAWATYNEYLNNNINH